MNRELKFRAWDKHEGKWLFGYERPNLGGFSLIGEVVFFGELQKFSLGYYQHISFMQYTGVKDKFGTEIYEGDIIKTDGNYLREVKWNVYDNHQGYDIDTDDTDLEVVGHIFETPNLLTIQHEENIKHLESIISKRDKKIIDARCAGINQSETALKYKISPTRVRQILEKWRYLLPEDLRV